MSKVGDLKKKVDIFNSQTVIVQNNAYILSKNNFFLV